MKWMHARASWVALVLGCAGSDESEAAAPTAEAPVAMDTASCAVPPTCVDIEVPFIATKACCTPVTACGYVAPELSEENMMLFPDTDDFIAMLAAGDPEGRCVPETFLFNEQPGLWKHRVEVDEGEDILITPDCQSFSLAAFILPGCCMPDNQCGLSTDESWPTLQVLAGGIESPFTKPECVPAAELNQQFRDSGVLSSLARTRAAGSCDHATLAAELPPR